MKKIIVLIAACALNFSAYAKNTENNKRQPPDVKTLMECIMKNTDCGGFTPIDEGFINIKPHLSVSRIRLDNFCGLQINTFVAYVSGHTRYKMPDGSIYDGGKFNFTLQNDYRYTIYSLDQSKDGTPCKMVGGWHPDDGSTRIENIDLAKKLVNPNKADKAASGNDR